MSIQLEITVFGFSECLEIDFPGQYHSTTESGSVFLYSDLFFFVRQRSSQISSLLLLSIAFFFLQLRMFPYIGKWVVMIVILHTTVTLSLEN